MFASLRALFSWVTVYFIDEGQALNPARPTSLKTVPARPKIRPGQEDVKSRRQLIKGGRRRLLRNYVGVRRRPEHALSNPATTVNDRVVDHGVGGPDPLNIMWVQVTEVTRRRQSS